MATSTSKTATANRPAKLTRSEKNDDVKRRLFEAAAKMVGRHGYADASVARITDAAGVAQGTFYNHFENRQELLDQLLPVIGQQMVAFIRMRIDQAGSEVEKEVTRFRAFFDFLRETPEFLRILNEAEVYAPTAYERHLDNISTAYVRLLKRARGPGRVGDYTDEELEVIVHVLMGARGYLSRRYAYGEDGLQAVPEHVFSAYEKLISGGLFDI
ncbi:MAG: TetR/AcrR family transcriptional regulator [Bosea sp. (in: a-proteobacteria)]|uniref:TetR/AcrR family transcriptional regulator n=1 Tax=Bosea sp. (in: a-proteobacteria) TaxID=1871050 RepID=UPI00273568DB|nr:TetR/AcrR family transcriptional regulator [Bosea sp. (in: a-proteobacteria)]MDP3600560.1 TetR/AcrR family transcriptional regulator [Bosea sp. (in: a-proteobacteria)]